MNLIIIIIVAAICQYFGPWWTAALIPFITLAWQPTATSFKAFATGFVAIAILWFGYGLYLHTSSEGAMSNRIAQIFSLPNGFLLLAVTTLVGGLVGGFAGLSGHLARKIW
ncbi:hypothetical protein DSL64_14845 [Dyadobacter luteus]|jgi:hypothetical protein|uniref:Uncharacterized protein n=1 Tax=Dyadobacter luteus TaxID=2259619 RepID=A0A3D8YAT3_9BACT|nr:hypothetical protein [Dyadobacter luteus]REA60386.1 hypothetical protein DSL64_14845 [Dyadobacter luteus]